VDALLLIDDVALFVVDVFVTGCVVVDVVVTGFFVVDVVVVDLTSTFVIDVFPIDELASLFFESDVFLVVILEQ